VWVCYRRPDQLEAEDHRGRVGQGERKRYCVQRAGRPTRQGILDSGLILTLPLVLLCSSPPRTAVGHTRFSAHGHIMLIGASDPMVCMVHVFRARARARLSTTSRRCSPPSSRRNSNRTATTHGSTNWSTRASTFWPQPVGLPPLCVEPCLRRSLGFGSVKRRPGGDVWFKAQALLLRAGIIAAWRCLGVIHDPRSILASVSPFTLPARQGGTPLASMLSEALFNPI